MKQLSATVAICIFLIGMTIYRTRGTTTRLPAAVESAPSAAVVTPKPKSPSAPKVRKDADLAQIQRYEILQKKVFLTPTEQREKSALLNDAAFLRGLRQRLLRSALTPDEAVAQNAALDLLLEALKSGNNEVATEVLRQVVTDGQIEDDKMETQSRQALAGVKAEALLGWSARQPASADEIAGMLPGPVSRKIWQNVVNAQQSNVTESAGLAP